MKLPLINGFITIEANKFIYNSSNINYKKHDNIYVPSLMMSDGELDNLIEIVLENELILMVKTAETLHEVGLCDSRFKLSPIMLLHKMGLLPHCTVVGGVYLDKDDTSLMAQENAKLVLTPTMSAGYGYGLPPVISYINAGLNITLGTGDNVFNQKADILQEAKFLQLATSSSMNKQSAISLPDLSQILCGAKSYAADIQKILY